MNEGIRVYNIELFKKFVVQFFFFSSSNSRQLTILEYLLFNKSLIIRLNSIAPRAQMDKFYSLLSQIHGTTFLA